MRDTITVFAEVYDNRQKGSEPVTLLTTVTDGSGTVPFRSEETVEAYAFEPTRHAWAHKVDVPLRELPPGMYTVRVEARPRNGVDAPVVCEVSFTVHATASTTS